MMKWKFTFRFKHLLLLLLISLLGNASFAQGPLSGIYTIGFTPGYSTLTAAVDSLTANGVSGPVTFNLLAATYNEQLAITAIAGASAVNTITFKGLGDLTKISYSPSASNLPVIGLNAAKHFVFDSLYVQVLGAQGWGFNFRNQADSNTVRNCHITLPGIATQHKGICAIASLDGVTIVGNNANYLLVENNLIESGNQSIHVQGTTPYMTGNKFIGNTLLQFAFIGMNLSSNTMMDVRSNTLTSSVAGARNAITMWPTGILVNVIGNNIYVNSYVANTRLIQVANDLGGGAAGGDIVIANNMVQYAGTYTSEASCIYTKNTSYLYIYNNTAKIASGSGSKCIWLDALGPDNNVFLKNNNITSYVSGSELLRKHAMISATSSNNNFYNPNGFNVYWNATYTSLSSYQSASADLGSVPLNPMFVSNTDLHISPTNTAFDGLGTPLAAITTDIDGDPRSITTPDIGADEFAVAAVDAAISALPGIYGQCPGTNSIVATVSNTGIVALTSVIINWQLNGVAQTPVTYTTTIPVGGSANVTLGSVTFVSGTTYNFTVWSSMPNGVADLNPANDTFTANGVVTSIFGTFTIGATGDFATFGAAVSYITSTGVCGPVVFNVLTDTFIENIVIGPIVGASATNTITFQSATGDSTSVLIEHNNTGSTAVLYVDGGSYLRFKGLSFKATSSSWNRVIQLGNGATNNIFQNNVLYGISGTDDENFAGFYNGSGTVNDNNNTYKNNIIYGCRSGIYLKGVSVGNPETGTVVMNNKIVGAERFGIRTRWHSGALISGNIVEVTGTGAVDGIIMEYAESPIVENNEITSISTYSGTPTKSGIYLSYATNAIQVKGNKIVLSGSYNTNGLNYANCTSTSANKGLAANNFISILNGVSLTYGIRLYPTVSYQVFAFNSIFVNGTSNTDTRGINPTSQASYIELYNNNVVSNKYPTLYEGSSVVASDYNNYYSTTSQYGYYTTAYNNFASFAALVASLATSSGFETHSISVDPQFTSNTNLHTTLIALNGAGLAMANVTTDIDGQPRNATTPDIGADEFTPANNDAGITAMPGITTSCPGQQDVYATITNFGMLNLTSATINWKVNGVSQTPVTYSGSLASYGNANVLLGSFNFAAGMVYNFKVWPSNPNGQADGNAINDTLTMLGIQASLIGTYTIGGASPDYVSFNAAVTALTNFGVCGPVVFEIAPGTYTEQVVLPTINGVSATNTITFTSQNGDSTSVNLEWDTNSGLMIFTLDHSDYVTIEKITIRSTTTGNNGQVVRLYSCNHVNILNNILQGPVLTASGTSAVIVSDSGSSSDVLIANNKLLNSNNAIYYSGGSGTMNENVIIENNIIDGFFFHAIFATFHKNLIFRNNYIHNGQSTANPLYAVEITNCNEGQKLIGNTININANAVVQGIRYITVPAISSNPNLIANNFVSVSGGTGDNYGIVLSNVSNTNVYNNSVNIYGGSNTIGGYVNMAAAGGYGNIRLTNNSFANTAGGRAFYCPDDAMSPGQIVYQDYNNYYSTGPVAVQFGVWDASVLADLQLIEPHSKLVNPVYASPTNLHCYSPFLMTAGKPLASVLVDIDGETRDLLHPSIGGDEFTLFTVDAGMSAFVGLGVICPGTSDIIATISNFGLVAITQITVNWSVNGVAQTTVVVTDTIPVGGSINVNLGTYTFMAGYIYDLVGSTSMPNGIADPNTVNDGASNLGVQTAAGGTYTIGATGDFASIGAAQQFIQLYGVCGPVVFNILPGTYTEQVSLVEVTGVSATNTVTWQSSTGNKTDVTIQYAGSGTGNNFVWAFNGADYNIVQNITIKSTTANNYGRVVVFQNTSNYNVVNGNIIESVITTSSTATPIYSYSDSKDEYNIISNNTITGGYYGIYWYGSSANLENGNQFLNNNITNFYYYGLYNYYQYANTISGNYVYQNPGGSTSGYPIYAAYCDGPIVVTNNKLYDDAGSYSYGLRIYYCDADASAPGLVANNWVSVVNNSYPYGLYLYYSNNMKVYNNSVRIEGGTTSYGCYIYGSAASGVYDFKNNSIVNLGTGGYCLYGTSTVLAGFTSDHNNLYSNSANLCYFSSYYTTLAAWQNLYPGDVLNTDGSYLGADNLHSNSLYLDGAGIAVPEVTTDIDGEARDPFTPDIGADEFTLANNDAAITALPGVNAYCPGVSNIVATVSNYGLVNMNSVVINWMVNGVLQTPFSNTTTIPVGTSSDIVIGTYNLLAGTTYDFTVWTTLPNNSNDPNSGNDSITVSGVTTAVYGIYTIGATGDFTTFGDAINFVANNGVCGPVVFNVQSGTYNEQVTIPNIIGVSSFNTITFQSISGVNTDVVVKYGAVGTNDNWVLAWTGGDYVSVLNMSFQSTTSTTYGRVVEFRGNSSYNTLSNCIVQSIVTTSSNAAGIRSYTDGNDEYNTIIGNTITGGYYGIYWYGSSSSLEQGNQFIDNSITMYYYYGFYNYYQYANTISGNYVFQNPSGSTTCYPFYAAYCDGPIVVTGNKIHDNAGSTFYGMRIYYCDADASAPGLVANNMISSQGNSSTQYGLYLYYSNNTKVYHNSVRIQNGGTNYACYIYGSATSGVYDFKNNSIANMNTAGYCLYGTSTGLVGLTSDHNNLYSNSTTLCYFTTSYANITAWQNIYPGDLLSVDPEYLASDNLHTASIYLNAAGTPVPEVTTDFDGDIRNANSPDIGADEFNLALPPVDLALSRLYYYGEVPMAGADDVVNVTIQNVGNDDQYNYPVILNITGANTFIDTVFIPYIATGTVMTIDFAPFTPTVVGLNLISVSVPNDGDNTNNLLTGYNHATLNTVSLADTTATAGSGGNNDANGHIYWNKQFMTGLKAVSSIQAYISNDVNNVGNTVYGAVMNASQNLVALSNPYVLTTGDLSTYITLTFPDPSLTLFLNAEYYAGFAQTPTVGGNYFPIGYQDEIPMRPNTYFYSGNIDGTGFTAYANDRRWMIKATLSDPAPYDAACTAIPEPLGGCGLGMETVTIKIQNFGSNAISGNLTAYYQVNNGTVVSQAVSTGIPSGDTLIFSFTTLADFTTTADSIFDLTAWVSLTGDLNPNNDTAYIGVQSLYQPPAPIGVDATVLYGSMATISVISTDSIMWFDDPMSPSPIATGNNLTIGPLYDTATYYAMAGGTGGSLGITEINLGGTDYIEIQNLSSSEVDATGWVVAISDSYTIINSVNIYYWNLGLIAGDQVLYKSDNTTDNYWGNNIFWNPGAPPSFRGWAMIVDDQGEIVDMVIWGWTAAEIAAWTPVINGFTLNPSAAWTGDALMNYPSDFITRINYDNDDANDWVNISTGNIGFANVGLNISTSIGSCVSAFVQVNAYVVNIPANDIGVVAAYSPVSGTNLSNAETVSVEINNWGSLPANLFQITYDISGAASSTVTELVVLTPAIASGTSSTFSFNTPANLSAYGVYHFNVFTQLSGDGFAANDTLSFFVVNSPPVFCSSGATSSGNEEIVQVNLSNISNYSFPSGSMYSNYNNSVAPGILVQGNTHQISITSGFAPGSSTSYSCWVEVYIDWNNDGVYTEPQETAFSSAITSSQTITGMLAVPLTAPLGNHSMRVVMEQTTSAAGVIPCGTYTYGETEDYQVFVQPPYANDAGAITILSPNGTLLENSTYPVEVVVYNYGTNAITNMNVVYTVNGLNPVSTAYVGSLPSFTSDTIILGNVTVPGGNFEICAYTVLANDNSPLNDATCAMLYANPQYNLAMLSIDAPIEGCDLGLEEVTVTFTNLADTVFGNIPLSFYTSNMAAPVTETYTGTVNPGDTATYTFSTLINLAVTVNTEFEIYAYVNYPLDPVQANDTATSLVNSLTIPAAPIVNNVTIWAGTTTTLEVISPNPNLLYAWFDAMGGNLLETGTQYLTPPLFDTTTFVVQASNAVIGDIQVGTQTNVTATTGYPSPYGSYYWGNRNQFLIRADELIALGFGAGKINSLAFRTVSVVPLPLTNFTMKIGHTTATAITTWDPSPLTQVYFNPSFVDVVGWNVHEFNDPFEWDGVSNVIVETCFNNSSYLSGSQVQYSNVGFNASVNYHADASTVCSSTATSSITNSQRPNMLLNILIPGCASYTEVTANVQYANLDGAILDITSPVSASNMNNAAVTIDIYNNGLQSFSNFNVQYTLNGGAPVTQLVNTTVAPGQIYSFTFTDSVSASTFGTYTICAKIILVGDGYAANDQFCTTFTNWDGNGESCATAFPYLMINEPPVYQTTMHPYDRQWWRFEVPITATNVNVSLCGSSFDTKLEVHNECPASSFLLSSFLGANDNSCGQQSLVHFNALSAGTYYARVFGYQGEFGDYVLEITGTFPDILLVNFNVTQISCNGAANGSIVTSITPILPGATLPLTYAWSNGATGLTLNNLAPGIYTLTITDALGIPQIESVTITQPPAMALSLAGTNVTAIGANNGMITTAVSGGVSPYTFSWSNGATTQNIAAAYAGVYSLTVWDANNCILEDDITINSPLPTGWTVTPTANSHLIIVSQNSNITLDGLNAAYGSLIGVFYNQNGTMVCAGWAYWSGMSTSITAYGATPPIDNGYQVGETFVWRLYEASLGVEYSGPACYLSGYPNQGTYATGGFSGINCLHAQSIITHAINLPLGWSIWSTYVTPVNANMATIFSSITSSVTIVKSGSGLIYWPLYSLNTIGNAVMGQGYQIKMGAAQTLNVQGLLINPVVSPFNIPGGWSIMGYLRTSPMNAVTVMSPIVSQIIIVKSGGGQIYWPLYNLNTIGNMVPGQGYQIKMLSLQSFTFPANTAAPTKSEAIPVQPEKYNKVNNTGHNMSLGILEDAWDVAPQEGDEIGVFNAKGDLIGSSVYQNGFNAITVWGDDSYTENTTEGIVNGDVFTLKLWSYSTGTEQELVVKSWLQGNDQYAKDAISVIEKLDVLDENYNGFRLYQNVPNPFKDVTEISFNLPEASHVRLVVYNALGEMIEELVSARYDAGKYSVQFKTANLSSGTYFYKIVSDKFTDTKVMNIQ